MKAITIAQPVAAAHVAGNKRIENRKWRPKAPPGLVAIHTGTRWWGGLRDDGGSIVSQSVHPGGCAQVRARWPEMPPPETLPTRAILGVMEIRQILPPADPQVAGDPWALGPWCWAAERTWALPEPLSWPKGAQRLWNIPDSSDEGRALHALTKRPWLPPIHGDGNALIVWLARMAREEPGRRPGRTPERWKAGGVVRCTGGHVYHWGDLSRLKGTIRCDGPGPDGSLCGLPALITFPEDRASVGPVIS